MEKVTGLYQRPGSAYWWLRFEYEGQRIHRSTQTTDLEEAKKILRKTKLDLLEAGRLIKKKEKTGVKVMTLSKALDLVEVEHYRKTKSSVAIVSQLGVLRQILGDIPVDKIDKTQFNKLKVALRQRAVANGTINRYLASLNRTLMHVAEYHGIEVQPVRQVYVKESGQRLRIISNQEEFVIREWFSNYKPGHNYQKWSGQDLVDIYDTFVQTGMRRAELFNAQVKHLRNNLLELPTHKTDHKGQRTVVLNNYVQAIMYRRISGKDLDDYIFPYAMRAFSDVWRIMRDALSITDDDFVVHTTRHTFVSRLAMKGANIYKVSKLLGHSSVVTTERYGHLFNGDLQDVVDMLE